MAQAEAAQRWLGIDPGLAIIGWAILDGQPDLSAQLVDYGIIETSKHLSTPRRLVEIEQDIHALLEEFSPQAIAMEMPFFSRQIKAAGGVMQALGVINLVIYREKSIQPIFLHQSSWKCHLGNGKANKAEVAAMVQNFFGLEDLPIDDSVDAIAIALAGLNGVRNEIN
ncbi:crossover junction endodeoxyribonuclease RuvC [Synechocystis sp. FACHB-383]|uniref:crossover junction endodeoxyribonuclease RuvC n=1 Tax=Synechocystis sp. FACHB-383 TaxID=2692864 RepID=UPI00168498DB|nr:crossover junction endodeoxyribonuclease RuvC [Synechocystis sp. FACHB-383]MBD2651950.1 crossover junction endodeoxyribonuclease RuvC [Synechocystis sp. FACHB-383]